MVAGSAARTIRGSGRLVLSPTDLATSFPYGGVEVGRTRAVALLPLGSMFRVESEGLGEATDILEADNRYVLTAIVRGWDDDAVEQLMSDGQVEGSLTRHRGWTSPGNVTPGASALDRALTVLYVPDDTVNVPAVLAYRGVPHLTDGSELLWQRREELAISISFECLRDESDRILAVQRLPDLAL